MGTLTGNAPKLDEHCLHKLPTSCRLTSTPLCCACADLRPHSSTYSVYVDGIGFVQRGTRWQGYCWYCKEFWNNRVQAADPPVPLTRCRIPDFPEQTEFLNTWFDFHRGFKQEPTLNGQFREIQLAFESWIDVPPGYLPRLLSEVRAGHAPNRGVFQSITATSDNIPESAEPERTVEDAIDELLNELSDEELPLETAETSPLAERQNIANQGEQVTRERRRSRREGVAERMTRVFGTREELASDDYQSPIGDMFARAWRRYQTAQAPETTQQNAAINLANAADQGYGVIQEAVEAIRQNESVAILRSNLRELQHDFAILEEYFGELNTAQEFPLWGLQLFEIDQQLLERLSPARQEIERARLLQFSARHPAGYQSLSQFLQGSEQYAIPQSTGFSSLHQTRPDRRQQIPIAAGAQLGPVPRGLDNDGSRPEAQEDGKLTVKLSCQVCYTQLATQAVLPCGHMCMCTYCADIAMPTLPHARTTPQDQRAKCPVCRKRATSIVRIHY